MAFTYTTIADYLVGQFLGIAEANKIKNNVRRIFEDILGTPATQAAAANTLATARTRSVGTSVAAGGVAISNSCGTFSTLSTTAVDITNLSVQITTSGRPVFIGFISAPSIPGWSSVYLSQDEAGGEADFAILGEITFIRDSTLIAKNALANTGRSSSANVGEAYHPSSAFNHIDEVAAGTYTYKAQARVKVGPASTSISAWNVRLVAYEL